MRAASIHLICHELSCHTSPLNPCNRAEERNSYSLTSCLFFLYARIHIQWAWIEAHLVSVHDCKGHRRDSTWYLRETDKTYIQLDGHHHLAFNTQNVCVWPTTSFNMRPVSWAATVIASFWAPWVKFVVSSGSTYWSLIVTDKNLLPAYQFLTMIEWAYSQLGNLPIHCIMPMLSAAGGSSIHIICTMPQWCSIW